MRNTYHPRLRPNDYELIGVSTYDGLVLIDTVDFKGFSDPASITRKAGALGPAVYDNPWALDPRNTVVGCTFDSALNRVYVRPYTLGGQIPSGVNNAIFHEKDGCVTGVSVGGQMFTQGNLLLNKAPQGTRTDIGGMTFLHDSRPFGQVVLWEGDWNIIVYPEITNQKQIDVSYNGGVDSALQLAVNGDWPLVGLPTVAMHSWNTIMSTPGVAPAYFNIVSIQSPSGVDFNKPLTLMLTGNTTDCMADFTIPLAVAPTGNAYAAQSFKDARDRVNGTAIPASQTPSLPLGTSFFYDSTLKKLHVRVRLPASTGGFNPPWGSVFNGAPVYIRFD